MKSNMELKEKIEINKKIKSYVGENSFIISLQKQLKTSKYLQKVEHNGRMIKVLSDKQYESAISILKCI